MLNDAMVETQVAGLAARSKKWRQKAKKLAIYATVTAILGIGTYYAGSLLGPAISLTGAIDIPPQAASLVAGAAASPTISTSISSSVDTLTSSFFPILAIFGFAVAMIGGAVLIFGAETGEFTRKFIYVGIATGMMAFGGLALGWTEPADHDAAAPLTDALTKVLIMSPKEINPAGYYVLAQDRINKGVSKDDDILRKAAKSLQAKNLGFSADPRVLFVIEHTVYGKAQSAAAINYARPRLVRQDIAAAISRGFFVASLVQAAIAVGFCCLGWLIGRRLRRVKQVLGTRKVVE